MNLEFKRILLLFDSFRIKEHKLIKMLATIVLTILFLSVSTAQEETAKRLIQNQASLVNHKTTIFPSSHQQDFIVNHSVELNEKLPTPEKSVLKKVNPVRQSWKMTKWIFKAIFCLVAIIIIVVVIYCCCNRRT